MFFCTARYINIYIYIYNIDKNIGVTKYVLYKTEE